ncbi:MAG TPA: class I SAM-dependent methyltransferase [Candidatus Angelobacter sp.]|nr:class I SAM-dependent methyltransferase [Candidatus Angelobacter sp.]
MEARPSVANVHSFWNTEACGSHFVRDYASEKEFFEKFREHRYRTEWHIPLLVPFTESKGKKVLEIGTGNGADGAMFALNGACYTGVDLTEAALEATRKHFAALGLGGSFQKENAERLSFPDASFDLVYSHGVLHHTPNPQAAINEVHRVLKPDGHAIIMLYHRHSFNYYVRIMSFMRLRVFLKLLSRAGRWRRDRERVLTESLAGLRGNSDNRVWKIHYHNFLREGWSYLRPENFVHHCTDGPECPVAFAFTRPEANRLFSHFRGLRMNVAHLPLNKYPLVNRLPFSVEKLLAARIGWYLFIFATK